VSNWYLRISQSSIEETLTIIGYGIGPMILSPLSEVPSIGRNPTYMFTLFLFVVLQVPAFTATNWSTLMAMRFLTGFLGSPALATAGASIADVWSPMYAPYGIALWSIGGGEVTLSHIHFLVIKYSVKLLGLCWDRLSVDLLPWRKVGSGK
jgi:MFS transporter, DHA1 family, multidrug resistance protein